MSVMLFEREQDENMEERKYERKGAVGAERTVIGTRRSSCVVSLKGALLSKDEAMVRTRERNVNMVT